MAKKKQQQYRSIRGTARYPRLTTPDTKYNELGTYQANLRMEGDAAQQMIDMIQEIAVQELGEKLPVSDAIVKIKGKYQPNEANSCFQPEFDRETGEMTGAWIFRFQARNIEVTDKKTGEKSVWDRKPKIFSAGGKLVQNVKVGGGTEMVVVFTTYVSKRSDGEKSLQLQPLAVQIYKLVEYTSGGASASDYGLEATDGWEPENEDADGMDDGMIDSSSDDNASDLQEGEDDF